MFTSDGTGFGEVVVGFVRAGFVSQNICHSLNESIRHVVHKAGFVRPLHILCQVRSSAVYYRWGVG